MQLSHPKVIYIMLLMVLAAFASASVVAQPQPLKMVELNPSSGCPGTVVVLTAVFPLDRLQAPLGGDGLKILVTSDPDGLIGDGKFGIVMNEGIEVRGEFTVSESVCRRPYTVTVSITSEANAVAAISESASATFTTGGDGCPRLPICDPVGGVVVPTNTLAVLTPYLALTGLIAAVSAAVVIKRRRD